MLFWIFLLIAFIMAVYTAAMMSATLLGFVVFYLVAMVLYTLIAIVIMGLISWFIPRTHEPKVRNRHRYLITRFTNTEVFYLKDGKEQSFPMDKIDYVVNPSKRDFLEFEEYEDGGPQGYWLWDKYNYPTKIILYVKGEN